VREAVARVEAGSGAEIVPVVVDASSEYEIASWRAAALGALAGTLTAALVAWLRPAWGGAPPTLLALPAVGALAGAALARLPALRRALVGRDRLDARVESAAFEAFVRHEVFRTRDRTGLLIFVSLFEHEVRILADEGVHACVPPEEWQALARLVAGEMRAQSPGKALLTAVERAGGLVAARGPRRASDDANELPDAPVERRV
jgi:putative membrane protein